MTALTYLLARFVPIGLSFPDALKPVPALTLAAMLVTVSATAGIVEEAAFRGYMQGPIERRHGPVTAIVVVSVVFGLAHLTGSEMTPARMFLVAVSSVGYGILVHLTGSILPAVVLHASGDVLGFGLLWLSSLHVTSGGGSQPPAWSDGDLWLDGLATIVASAGAIWAFRRLADAARTASREPA